MASLNKACILGRVGQNPEKGQSQNAPVNLSVATHEVWRDKQGNKQEDLQWHRVVVWGAQGDNVLKYVKKGDLLYIEGKIQTDSYEKDGQKLYATKIVAREVKFLTTKPQQSQQQPQGHNQQQMPPQNSYQPPQMNEVPW
jgi:single-strand DNA-binding protein